MVINFTPHLETIAYLPFKAILTQARISCANDSTCVDHLTGLLCWDLNVQNALSSLKS